MNPQDKLNALRAELKALNDTNARLYRALVALEAGLTPVAEAMARQLRYAKADNDIKIDLTMDEIRALEQGIVTAN